MEKQAFLCHRCGWCCQHLVSYNPTYKCEVGIPLFNREIPLFPADLVVPHFVFGQVSGNNFEVKLSLISQLSSNVCPHYSSTGCGIYEKRPAFCQAWPMAATPLMNGKFKTEWNAKLCPTGLNTIPNENIQEAGRRLARYMSELSEYIMTTKEPVYIMDVHYKVGYKTLKWCGVSLDSPPRAHKFPLLTKF